MSYFSTIYSDNSLPIRAKTVYMYLRDRSDKERKCWPGINTIAAELIMYNKLRKLKRAKKKT